MAFSLDQFYRLNRRALIWIILFALIWLMRDFFSLIFLTFILGFIAISLARFAQRHLRVGHGFAIIVIYFCFLIAMVSFVKYVTPRVIRESKTLVGNLGQTEETLLGLKNQLVQRYPSFDPLIMGYVRSLLPEDNLRRTSGTAAFNAPAPAPAPPVNGAKAPVDAAADAVARVHDDEILAKSMMNMLADRLREHLPNMIVFLWRASATMLLALFFSFLITLDITRLGREIESLRASRLREFYEQTAQPVVHFAYVLGRAFQAQVAIALINAVLTLVGMLILGIPSRAMLTLIVFICSFIPVLGVFLSTVPILLIAINAGGLNMTVAVVAMVMIVHAIEAYLLNPMIYGKHLKLNPVLVLMILFIGHKAFGLWGMLLGVPVAYYFIHYVFGVPVWDDRKTQPSKPLAAMPRAAEPSDGAAKMQQEEIAVHAGEPREK
jgi:predicted PurR-regulated permease PerM